MEAATIDWKSIDSKFVKDDLYEHINAPQWIDFSSPHHHSPDDDAWFCRPDCNHPKTVEDFLKQNSTSKLQRLASVSEVLPFGDLTRRDAALKKRGLTQNSKVLNKDSKCSRFVEDIENQNPNFSTPPNQKAKFMKESIKSSTEKEQSNNFSRKEETPKLRSTLSTRNLFGGRDILNQITEFCNELRRMAMRAKERENGEKENVKRSSVSENKMEEKEGFGDDSGDLDEGGRETKPLLEVSKGKCEAVEKSNVKERLRRKKRNDEAENTPISVDLKNIRRQEKESLLQIRTYPPSPQCFSANREPTKATPAKAFRSRPPERGILQELEQSNKEERGILQELEQSRKDVRKDEVSHQGRSEEREARRTLDVFWFLKPCTLSS